MELPPIPQDDLIDVLEMTEKMEDFIYDILEENDLNLAMSALMGATINCVLAQCVSIEEVIFHRKRALIISLILGMSGCSLTIQKDKEEHSTSIELKPIIPKLSSQLLIKLRCKHFLRTLKPLC